MQPFVAVIDYGIGNLRSAQKALISQGARTELTSQSDEIYKADGVVLPGVGHFGTCIKALTDAGLDVVVKELVQNQKPFLGICVGMQMLYESSVEAPGVPGLGVFAGEITTLPDDVLRPQIQWNPIKVRHQHYLTEGLDGEWMYFVHSYAPKFDSSDSFDETCVASAKYGREFPAVVSSGSVAATQFHPEKSGKAGLRLIANFIGSLK